LDTGTKKDSAEKNRFEVIALDHVERKWSPSGSVKKGRVWHSMLDYGGGDWFYGNKGVPSSTLHGIASRKCMFS
jgi:hypothetical protein